MLLPRHRPPGLKRPVQAGDTASAGSKTQCSHRVLGSRDGNGGPILSVRRLENNLRGKRFPAISAAGLLVRGNGQLDKQNGRID